MFGSFTPPASAAASPQGPRAELERHFTAHSGRVGLASETSPGRGTVPHQSHRPSTASMGHRSRYQRRRNRLRKVNSTRNKRIGPRTA